MLINQANIWVTLPRLCGILSACRVHTVLQGWGGANGHRQCLVKRKIFAWKLPVNIWVGRVGADQCVSELVWFSFSVDLCAVSHTWPKRGSGCGQEPTSLAQTDSTCLRTHILAIIQWKCQHLHSLSRSSQGPSNGPGKTRKHLKYYRLTSGDESQGKPVIKMVIKCVSK